MRRRITTGIAAATGAAALLIGATAAPALATTRPTSGTTGNDIFAWTTGTFDYHQSHGGDDFGFDNNSGPNIDMRWVKCTDRNVFGSTIFDIEPAEGRQTIGTNFLAGTCINSQYRPYLSTDRNRTFTGVSTYNVNFA